MRNFIEHSDLMNNKSFLLWFLMTSFPLGLINGEDSIDEVMGSKYNNLINQKFIDEFTGYYDGIFEKTDGYLDDPKAVKIFLNDGDELIIEFHAGDIVYYLNDEMLGCTGPEYVVQKIPFAKFLEYTKVKNNFEILLLMPMVRIEEHESDEYRRYVLSILNSIEVLEDDLADICACIINNCLAED